MSLKNVYTNMKRRCYNNYAVGYGANPWYRDKGIKVCDDWLDSFENFEAWALSHGYKEGLTIDRIDSDGNYEPNNCRWVTVSENSKRAIEKRRAGRSSNTGNYYVCEHHPGLFVKILEVGFSYSEARRRASQLTSEARASDPYNNRHVIFSIGKTQKYTKEGDYLWDYYSKGLG